MEKWNQGGTHFEIEPDLTSSQNDDSIHRQKTDAIESFAKKRISRPWATSIRAKDEKWKQSRTMYQAVLGTATAGEGDITWNATGVDRAGRPRGGTVRLRGSHLDARVQRDLGVLRDVHPAAGAGGI